MDVDVAVESRQQTLSNLILGTGFSLTGAGTIALGVLLPVISAKWGLNDDKSGQLFFLQFLGSSLGAIFSGKDRVRSLAAGYGLLVAGSCALAFVGRTSLFPVFFVFGLGLGLAMTSTNLLISDRFEHDRAAKLERFNFAWSFGAMVTPLLLVPFLRGASLRLLYFIFAGLYLLLLLWVMLRERGQGSEHGKSARAVVLPPQTVGTVLSLVPLLVLSVCAIGVETALSGWLTTYSHRASPFEFGGGAVATALFMFGIVFSRFAASTRLLARIGRQRAFRSALWGAAAAVVLLIAGHHPLAIDLAATLAGLSVGPQFPLLLSFLLERSPRGWIFAVAGMGSAVFPWLTGLLSSHYGSLRYGLLAPCGAAVLMLLVSAVRLDALKTPRVSIPA